MTRTSADARTDGVVDAWESTTPRRLGISRNFSGVIGFVNVALTGSLAAASRQLGISSPSLSKSIARLESQLNVRLLERSNKKMTLTAEGTLFFDECFPAVNRIIRVAGDLTSAGAEPAGYLRVSCSMSFGRLYIAKMLPSFCSSFPGIQFDVDLNDRSVDPVQSGVDVVIRYGEVSKGDFVARRLCDSGLVVCAAPSYLEQQGAPLTIDDLHQHRLILQRSADSGRPVEWKFYLGGEAVKRRFTGYAVANDSDLIAQAALYGFGLAQLDSRQIGKHLDSGDLCPVLTQYAPPASGYFVCYRNRPRVAPRVKAFVDHLFKYLASC
jgi:DNA-binding transcriptional LysR family regulator